MKKYYSTLRQHNGARFNMRMREVSAVTGHRWSSRAAARTFSTLGTARMFVYTHKNWSSVPFAPSERKESQFKAITVAITLGTRIRHFVLRVHGVVTSGRPWLRVFLLPASPYRTRRSAVRSSPQLDRIQKMPLVTQKQRMNDEGPI